MMPNFDKETPEHATILELCAKHSVSVVGISHIRGDEMILAYFNHNGDGYLYQDGRSVHTRHLFFYIVSSVGDEITSREDALILAKEVIGDDWVIEE